MRPRGVSCNWTRPRGRCYLGAVASWHRAAPPAWCATKHASPSGGAPAGWAMSGSLDGTCVWPVEVWSDRTRRRQGVGVLQVGCRAGDRWSAVADRGPWTHSSSIWAGVDGGMAVAGRVRSARGMLQQRRAGGAAVVAVLASGRGPLLAGVCVLAGGLREPCVAVPAGPRGLAAAAVAGCGEPVADPAVLSTVGRCWPADRTRRTV